MTTEMVMKCDWCGTRLVGAVPLQMGALGGVVVDFCRLDCAILWCTRERDKPKAPPPVFKATDQETWG